MKRIHYMKYFSFLLVLLISSNIYAETTPAWNASQEIANAIIKSSYIAVVNKVSEQTASPDSANNEFDVGSDPFLDELQAVLNNDSAQIALVNQNNIFVLKSIEKLKGQIQDKIYLFQDWINTYYYFTHNHPSGYQLIGQPHVDQMSNQLLVFLEPKTTYVTDPSQNLSILNSNFFGDYQLVTVAVPNQPNVYSTIKKKQISAAYKPFKDKLTFQIREDNIEFNAEDFSINLKVLSDIKIMTENSIDPYTVDLPLQTEFGKDIYKYLKPLLPKYWSR